MPNSELSLTYFQRVIFFGFVVCAFWFLYEGGKGLFVFSLSLSLSPRNKNHRCILIIQIQRYWPCLVCQFKHIFLVFK